MSDLLAEVDEAMRRERVEQFFKDHGKTIIAFVVLTIVMTGLISGYKHWKLTTGQKDTATLTALLEDENFPDNIAEAELDMRGGLRGVALITAGGAYLEQEKPEQALPLYKRAADDKGIPDDLRDLATLMVVQLDQDGADNLAMLESIMNDRNSPWRYYAMIEAASVHANERGEFDEAIALLNTIQQTENLTETLYNKARALSQVYTLKQSKQDQSS